MLVTLALEKRGQEALLEFKGSLGYIECSVFKGILNYIMRFLSQKQKIKQNVKPVSLNQLLPTMTFSRIIADCFLQNQQQRLKDDA